MENEKISQEEIKDEPKKRPIKKKKQHRKTKKADKIEEQECIKEVNEDFESDECKD